MFNFKCNNLAFRDTLKQIAAAAGCLSLVLSSNIFGQEPSDPEWLYGTDIIYSSPSNATKLGIGTTGPDAMLEVKGDADDVLRITSEASGGTKKMIRFGVDSDLPNYVRLRPDDGDGFAITNDGDDIGLFVDAASGANVGIGTDNPSTRLHVYSLGGDGDMRVETSSPSGSAHLFLKNDLSEWSLAAQSDEEFHIRDETYSKTIFTIQPNAPADMVYITTTGRVGIGTNSPAHKLDVDGTIRATEIRVESNGADFVFDEDYKLMPLNELEANIRSNKHLPGIPSAKEMQENGVGVSELQTKLLQKVEELTLYVIQQQKENEALKARVAELEGLQ